MLETCNERVKLLKAGFDGKRIEDLYIIGNNIKMVRSNLLYVAEEYHMIYTDRKRR